MAADVKFAYKDSTTGGSANGTTGYTTLSSTLRFKNADNNTGVATDDPMVRPSSGTVYSFWKNLRVRVVTNPDTALLSLRFKISATPTITGGSQAIDLAYSFIRAEDYVANSSASTVPQKIGINPTSDVNWTDNRLASNGTGGTAVANHLTASHANGSFWGGDLGSDMLYLCMEVGSGTALGGSIQPFNLILVFNEI